MVFSESVSFNLVSIRFLTYIFGGTKKTDEIYCESTSGEILEG